MQEQIDEAVMVLGFVAKDSRAIHISQIDINESLLQECGKSRLLK